MDIQFFEIQFFEIQFFEIQFFEIQFFEIQFFEIQFFEKTMKTMKNYERGYWAAVRKGACKLVSQCSPQRG